MAASCCGIGSYNCPSPATIREFHRSPNPHTSSSSCRAFMVWEGRSSERSGFSMNCGSLTGEHGHGFLLKMRSYRTPQSEEAGMHGNDSSASSTNHASCGADCMEKEVICDVRASCGILIDRRASVALLLATIFEPLQHHKRAMAADENAELSLILESYIDEKEGFTVLKPTQWNKIDKAGATVLFEDPQSKGNNVGVVVNPVKISSLSEFGTVDVVADKLLQAEKRKPSTNDVQLIKVNERQVHGGAPLYQLEYKLDSSRGVKRILSAVTVASKKLYILNVAYTDSSEKPLRPDTALELEQIVNSFDILY
eukprot:c6927_g1_i1 orf=92-1024(-)